MGRDQRRPKPLVGFQPGPHSSSRRDDFVSARSDGRIVMYGGRCRSTPQSIAVLLNFWQRRQHLIELNIDLFILFEYNFTYKPY